MTVAVEIPQQAQPLDPKNVVAVEIQPRQARPLDPEDVVVAENVDDLVTQDRCSCAAGDDQPY